MAYVDGPEEPYAYSGFVRALRARPYGGDPLAEINEVGGSGCRYPPHFLLDVGQFKVWWNWGRVRREMRVSGGWGSFGREEPN